MQAVVKINGFIDETGVDAGKVSQQIGEFFALAQDKGVDVDGITVLINSKGGNVEEAYNIIDTIRSYNLPITTHVVGDCASAATLIQLIAPLENRYATKIAKFLYHPVRYAFITDVTPQVLEEHYTAIKAIEASFVEFYADNLPASLPDAYELYMSDVELSANDVKGLNIISEIKPYGVTKTVAEATAFASNLKIKNMGFFDKYRAKKVQALELKTKDGMTMSCEELTAGQKIYMGGEIPSDGEYIMEDNTKVMVKDGLIEEVIKEEITKEEEKSPIEIELEDAKAKLAAMEAKYAELEAKLTAVTDEATETFEVLQAEAKANKLRADMLEARKTVGKAAIGSASDVKAIETVDLPDFVHQPDHLLKPAQIEAKKAYKFLGLIK